MSQKQGPGLQSLVSSRDAEARLHDLQREGVPGEKLMGEDEIKKIIKNNKKQRQRVVLKAPTVFHSL